MEVYFSRIGRKKAVQILLFCFLISVIVRLPTLCRPLSKHHEFITATILINIEAWRQAGGAQNLHFVPVTNFRHPGDLHAERSIRVDPAGNEVYMSLGPGWFIIPYLFFQAFHLPATVPWLAFLNLLVNLVTLILLFRLLEILIPQGLSYRYTRVLTGTLLFLFSPAPLWYYSNVFVNTAVMMPVILWILLLLLPMMQSAAGITAPKLLVLALAILLLIYIDWFALFLSVIPACMALFKGLKHRRYLILSFTLILALLAGIAIICIQFSAQTSWEQTMAYWKDRFLYRSFTNGSTGRLTSLPGMAMHLVTGFFPLLLILAVYIPWHWIYGQKTAFYFTSIERSFLAIYGSASLLYPLTLSSWAYNHEFAMLHIGIILAWLAARSIFIIPAPRMATSLIIACLLLSIGQYYFINRPGKYAPDGTEYDSFRKTGHQLQNISPDTKIFANLPRLCPMIEYYAGRNVTIMADSNEAKTYMRQWGVRKAVWAQSEDFNLISVHAIEP